MNLKNLFRDDDAVSPVIGVILMVAITVILAAVIASFVLGLGQSSDDVAPNASFNFDYDASDDEVEVVLGDGDSIASNELYVRGDLGGDIDCNWDESDSCNLDDPGDVTGTSGVGGFSPGTTTEVNAGQGVVFEGNPSSPALGDYDISIVWETAEDTATLETSEGPNA